MNAYRRPSRYTRKLIRYLRKLNLFTRLFTVFCILLVASTMFITFFNQSNYAKETEEGNIKYLSVLVQNAYFKLEQEKNRLEDSMSLLIQNDALLNALSRNAQLQALVDGGDAFATGLYAENARFIEELLLSTKNRNEGVRALILVTDHNQYTMSADENDPRGVFVRDLDTFYDTEIYTQAVKAQGYPVWRDSVKDSSTLFYEGADYQFSIEGCITLAYQIYRPDIKTPLGVLVCCIAPRYFTNSLQEYSSQNGGNTFLVGENGLVEGISADFSAPPFMEQRSSLLRRIFSQHQGNLLMEAHDQDLMVSFCGQPNFPLHIVNLTYRQHILQKVMQLGKLNFTVMCLVIVIGIGGFYLTAISISYPVNKLISAMKRVGSGDFSAAYKAESHDEIGVLCNEFDHMVSDMQSLIERVYVAEIRERELDLSQKNAQLDALQMQINPHFLYNTLDMIRWQCLYEAGGESAASDMIEKFCTLLRMTIKGDQQKETVQDSLDHAATYLDVVNFRYTNKIVLQTDLSFDPNAYLIPCLALQPILENAVRHGFQIELDHEKQILITGNISSQGNLIIQVSDNGSGMTESQLDALRQSMTHTEQTKNGIGLRNVNQRCHLCYGQNYGIHIESEEGQGTRVFLTIPAEKHM